MKTKNLKTVGTTNTLKGIAILAVLINHYLNLNISGNSTGFANAWIAIFFFLSGYGLFHSLKHQNLYTTKDLLLFYYQRIIRIFPLLWIAWIIELMVRRGNISFWIPTGIHASGHYWFIPALLQCYLLSPAIYLSIKNRSIISFLSFLSMLILVNLLGRQAPLIIKIASFFHICWRGIYFLHILVFFFGMLTPSIISPLKERKYDVTYIFIFWFYIFLIISLMIFLKIYSHANFIMVFAFNVAPLFFIILLCCYSIRYSIKIQFLEYLGSISYSIYLFHMSYYLLVSNLGAFSNNSTKELIAYIIIFPLFILICDYIERFGRSLNKKLKSLVIINGAQQIKD